MPEPSPFLTARQREDLRDSKRQALLAASVRAFNQRGYANTSLDDVAATLGVTKPVIYHYLGTKEQVLFECLRIGLHQLQQAAMPELDQAADSGLARLRRFLLRYAEIMMEDFGRCVVRTNDQALAPESRARFRAMKREIDDTLRRMIADAMADGSARVADVRLTAFAVAGALNWPANWFREDGAMTARDVAGQLVEILCAGLRPAAPTPDRQGRTFTT